MSNVPTIPSSTWNKLITFLIRNRVLGVTFLGDGGWRHPWHVQPVYDAIEETWRADIMPGFVNGLDASVQMPARLVGPETTERLKRLGKLPPDGETMVDARLSESALLPLLAWRAIGSDASPVSSSSNETAVTLQFEGVPPYFREMGVGSPPDDITLDLSGSAKSVRGEQESVDRRLLRACDLVLHQDRIGTSTQWTSGAGIDGSFAQFSVIYARKPDARNEAYVRAFAQWTPPLLTGPRDMVSGDWVDELQDVKHLATVYLVSLPGASPGSEPDGSWTPFVEHRVFWNLSHDTNHLRPALGKVQLSLNTGLAGGAGDALNNLILGQINDGNSVASEFIGRETVSGRFWTV